MTPELADWAGALEERPPQEILALAAQRFAPRVTFATGFGPEGCVLIDLIARQRLPIDVFTLDTGVLFPETYALWHRLEDRYRITIRAVRPSFTLHEARTIYDRLWERDPDRCCEVRKVLPLRAAVKGFDAWVTAIRRDQTPERASAKAAEWDPKFGLVKVNPLVAWSSEEVWSYLAANEVPTNPLHERGYPSIGCAPCTTPVAAGEDPRAGRWRDRAKTECGLHSRAPSESVSPTAASVGATTKGI
jgi:phosphoadenosine phosphosulfate reductase